MFERGVVEEVRAALAAGVSQTAAKALGLREIATLPEAEARERIVVRTRRYAAYQRKWMRRIPGLVSVDGTRSPEEVADAILEVARARQQLPRRRAARRRAADAGARPAAVLGRPPASAPTACSRSPHRDATSAASSRSGTPTARRRRCPATASASPPAGSPPRPGATEVTIETAGRRIAARMLNTLDTAHRRGGVHRR